MSAPKEFYRLSSPLPAGESLTGRPLYGRVDWYEKYRPAEWAEGVEFEQVTCPLAPQLHQHAGSRVGGLRVVLPSAKIADFTWTWYSEPIVTDRVAALFAEARLTGYRTKRVFVEKVKRPSRKPGPPLPTLHELDVVGRGGDAHPLSGIRLLYECPGCGLRRYSSFREGIVVDQSGWDGSDFFTVNGYPKFILISEQAKKVIVGNKLVNCLVVRSRDLRWGDMSRPEDHPENFTPPP